MSCRISRACAALVVTTCEERGVSVCVECARNYRDARAPTGRTRLSPVATPS